MATIALELPNGERVSGDALHWVFAIFAVLSEEQRKRVLDLVNGRLEFEVVAARNHVITVPGIPTAEAFGRF